MWKVVVKRVALAIGLIVAGVLVIGALWGQWSDLVAAYGWAKENPGQMNILIGVLGVFLFVLIAITVNPTLQAITAKLIRHQSPVPLREPPTAGDAEAPREVFVEPAPSVGSARNFNLELRNRPQEKRLYLELTNVLLPEAVHPQIEILDILWRSPETGNFVQVPSLHILNSHGSTATASARIPRPGALLNRVPLAIPFIDYGRNQVLVIPRPVDQRRPPHGLRQDGVWKAQFSIWTEKAAEEHELCFSVTGGIPVPCACEASSALARP